MNVGYNGFNEKIITFEADGTLDSAGVLVSLTEDGKAKKAEAQDTICGYGVNLRGEYCGVQVEGYVAVPQDGTVKCGMRKLSVDSEGRVTLSDTGREVLVVFTDGDTAGFIL